MVTKTHPIKSPLKAALDYILNPEKTDGKLLASSFGCGLETADIEFALAQSVPGIFAVNIAIFIGYKLRNFRGALAMALGTILPSFFIMLAIALFFQQFKQYQIVENIFKGIRPAVVALIAAPTFSMAKSAKINRYTIWIPIVSALLIWVLDVSPVYIIIIAGVGGFIYGKYKHKYSSK